MITTKQYRERRRQNVVQLAQQGRSAKQIASALGIGDSTVYAILYRKKYQPGVKVRKARP